MTISPDRVLVRQILLLSCAAFASAVSARISDPLLPQLASTFAISTGEAAHAISMFALAYGLLQLFYGPVGDRYGKFRIVTITTLASTVGSLGAAMAGSFHSLVIFRFLTGATAAAIIPLAMAWIADNVPYEQRQHTLAYFLSGQILGLISGQLLGGLFADLTGWRGALACLVVIYLAVGILLVLELRRSPSHGDAAARAPDGDSFLGHVKNILGNAWSRVILLSVLAEGAFLFGSLSFIPAYLHQRFGLTLTLAGAALGLFGIGGLSYTLFARYFVKTLGEQKLAAYGGGLLGLTFIILTLGEHWLWVVPAAWCAGFGFYMLHNTLQINATQMAPKARGTAVSLFASCFFLGQSMGVAAASQIIDRYGILTVFGISAVLLPLMGGTFSALLKRRHARMPRTD
ncbi:MAG: MFS transporter [Rhodocyclaceae bacterium]|nr:MAG: MFS transporter [Rhodocyclaceae bacterium]